MNPKTFTALVLSISICGICYGSTEASKESAKAMKIRAKAENKISIAIGQEVGEFTITDQQKTEAPAGYTGTQYTVKTNYGKTYKCEILEPSGFGKAMTFGMGAGADAMCTDFTKSSRVKSVKSTDNVNTPKASEHATTDSANVTKDGAKAAKIRTQAAKKISMAIGEEIGEFAITGQQKIKAPAGYNGTQYTVKTNYGKTYKCEILEPSGFGKAMTFGMGTGADAICTDFTRGSKDKGTANKASCNALLKAAGKC